MTVYISTEDIAFIAAAGIIFGVVVGYVFEKLDRKLRNSKGTYDEYN